MGNRNGVVVVAILFLSFMLAACAPGTRQYTGENISMFSSTSAVSVKKLYASGEYNSVMVAGAKAGADGYIAKITGNPEGLFFLYRDTNCTVRYGEDQIVQIPENEIVVKSGNAPLEGDINAGTD